MPPKRTPPGFPTQGRPNRRQPATQEGAGRMTVGPLLIDRPHREVTVHNRPVHLTPREFDLLWVLASHPGRVYRREELLHLVWGTETFVAVRTVDVHMAKLRHKLRTDDEQPDIAETIWGVGYRLRPGSL